MSLKRKDLFQVFTFEPVIQESVIADFLETGREHMHQITADELCVLQGNGPAWLTRPLSPCRKTDTLVIYREDAAVPDG